ncbi:hypothetical protein Shyhy01_03860 [Streptomyces hygroscopicus subsp. hygroscopicus]|nr:hypothetical protein Shyhy01_03860 [Streptomyces hygroscopicus subsp. hygroscopicus]
MRLESWKPFLAFSLRPLAEVHRTAGGTTGRERVGQVTRRTGPKPFSAAPEPRGPRSQTRGCYHPLRGTFATPSHANDPAHGMGCGDYALLLGQFRIGVRELPGSGDKGA